MFRGREEFGTLAPVATRNTGPETRSERFDVVVPLADDGSPTGYLPSDGHPSDWLVRVEFTVTPGRMWPSSAALVSTTEAAVTADMWRRVRIGDAISEARVQVELWGAVGALLGDSGLSDLVEDDDARTGRRYAPEHYREVGEVYNRAVDGGDAQPVQQVRRAFRTRYPDLSETTVKGWIRTAKARGYITRTARQPRRGQTSRPAVGRADEGKNDGER